jgi:TIR domain
MTTKPLNIFISYAHEDEIMKDDMEKFLITLKRDNAISVWQDRELKPGADYEKEIMDELSKADIILLLISQDFIASDFIYGKELKYAMERHENRTARVIPVILRKCDWQNLVFGKLVALPKDGNPVSGFSDKDEAYTQVAKGIYRAVNFMTK